MTIHSCSSSTASLALDHYPLSLYHIRRPLAAARGACERRCESIWCGGSEHGLDVWGRTERLALTDGVSLSRATGPAAAAPSVRGKPWRRRVFGAVSSHYRGGLFEAAAWPPEAASPTSFTASESNVRDSGGPVHTPKTKRDNSEPHGSAVPWIE